MGQTRGPAGAAGTTRNSARGSRASRGGAGGHSGSARQQAALGLLNERLIWDGHAGAGIPDGILAEAIEVCVFWCLSVSWYVLSCLLLFCSGFAKATS